MTTANGDVARFCPATKASEALASGHDRLMGIAISPGGAAVFAELGTGGILMLDGSNVSELASGLDKPMGVAIASDGSCYVAESGAGRVVKLAGGKVETVVDGLADPQGIHIAKDVLYILDVETKELSALSLATWARLPVWSSNRWAPSAHCPGR